MGAVPQLVEAKPLKSLRFGDAFARLFSVPLSGLRALKLHSLRFRGYVKWSRERQPWKLSSSKVSELGTRSLDLFCTFYSPVSAL